MATEFKATPITPVPIVPTALSKNLSGPMSMSHLQGEPKTGYVKIYITFVDSIDIHLKTSDSLLK